MGKSNIIVIGTRGSNLALYQAHAVKSALEELDPECRFELRIIKTQGDKNLKTPLSQIGDKGLFTKELENELYRGSIDLAVHSLKDLPTQMPEGLCLAAVLQRAEVRDALVSASGRKLHELSDGTVFATSSLRRRAALLSINEEFRITDIRGNVETRLKKMFDGHCEAMVMAAAGLQRLGLQDHITEIIDPEIILPAVGQGAIAIQTLCGSVLLDGILKQVNHQPTFRAVEAERSFLHTLQGGCQIPIGCYSHEQEDTLTLTGFVASTDGRELLRDRVSGPSSEGLNLGKMLANRLLEEGASAILDEIRSNQR